MIRAFSHTLLTVLILSIFFPLKASLPIEFDAGTYGCPPGSTPYIKTLNPYIGNTTYDSIYLSECFSTAPVFSYSIADAGIQAGQTYTLYLHFAEIYHGVGNVNPSGGNQSRIFHVEVEGVRILDSLNIHKLAGPAAALVYRYDVTAGPDGDIDVDFIEVVGDPKISAFEVRALGEPSAFPPSTYIFHINTGNILPVELTSFSATATDKQTANLTWTTASEENNHGFEIQQGNLKSGFTTIGFVKGVGTSASISNYSFETQSLPSGTYLFRLAQKDFNGAVHFSQMVEVTIRPGTESLITQLFPNPARTETTLRVLSSKNQHIDVSILSMEGKTITPSIAEYTQYGEQTDIRLNVENLPNGTYIVKISCAGVVSWEKMTVIE
ncbi:MAG: malectin domain-containing carbohydrate-binding protein [Bacteroidia bacterium]